MVTNAHDEYLNTPLGACERCNGEGYATHPDDLWMYDMMAYADYPDPSRLHVPIVMGVVRNILIVMIRKFY
jgi:hypothetical protein